MGDTVKNKNEESSHNRVLMATGTNAPEALGLGALLKVPKQQNLIFSLEELCDKADSDS